MEQVMVSVIVPVYNVQDYLERCVNSILAQTYQDFELILVDDGSTDNSPAICDRYQARDARVQVYHKENGGPCTARNMGLDLAKGKYICFVDSDDYIESVLLEKIVAVMEQQGIDWCGFGMVTEDLDGKVLNVVAYLPLEYTVQDEKSRMIFLLKYLLNYRTGWEQCNHIYRNSIIQENGIRFKGNQVAFAEDLLFSFEYWQYAISCVIMKDIMYHYVQHSQSLMWKAKERNVLPEIHELALNAYEVVKKAGHKEICEDFAIIYHHLMEWHARPYVAQKGVEWVANELAILGGSPFLPKQSEVAEHCFECLVHKYGKYSGFVTVAVIVRDFETIPKGLIENIRKQTLQKTDILLLTSCNLDVEEQAPGVRQCFCLENDLDHIIKTAFANAWGEYLYFAADTKPIAGNFLETMSNVIKYNGCSMAIATRWNTFLDKNSLPARYQFREYMKENEFDYQRAVFRSDLLENSGLAWVEDIQQHAVEMFLSDHIIFYKME